MSLPYQYGDDTCIPTQHFWALVGFWPVERRRNELAGGQKRAEVRLRRAASLCAGGVKPALREEEEHGPWMQDHFCRKDWGMDGKEGSSQTQEL